MDIQKVYTLEFIFRAYLDKSYRQTVQLAWKGVCPNVKKVGVGEAMQSL